MPDGRCAARALEPEGDEPGGDRAEEHAGAPVRLADRRHALHLQVVVLGGEQGDPCRLGVAGVVEPQAVRDSRQRATQSVRGGQVLGRNTLQRCLVKHDATFFGIDLPPAAGSAGDHAGGHLAGPGDTGRGSHRSSSTLTDSRPQVSRGDLSGSSGTLISLQIMRDLDDRLAGTAPVAGERGGRLGEPGDR